MNTPHCTPPLWFVARALLIFICFHPNVLTLFGGTIEWIMKEGTTAPERVVASGFGDVEPGNGPRTETSGAWEPRLKVYVIQNNITLEESLPILGSYSKTKDGVVFTPRFPFSDRMAYRAEFDMTPKDVTAKRYFTSNWKSNTPPKSPSTIVSQVYPSSNRVPENLLKFYLVFSDSMSGGGVYDHIHLYDENNQEVELPFLELGQELWDAPMQRLTLFIDPGRIKRGVKPLEDIGPSLMAGHSYKLMIDADWKDADRLPLLKSFQKNFLVEESDRTAIDPYQWEKKIPRADTSSPLMIRFGESMDFALAQRLIEIRQKDGTLIRGQITLLSHETEWSFTPDEPWKTGDYIIRATTIIEDLAGNNIGKPFEVDVFNTVQRWITEEYVDLPFTIR